MAAQNRGNQKHSRNYQHIEPGRQPVPAMMEQPREPSEYSKNSPQWGEQGQLQHIPEMQEMRDVEQVDQVEQVFWNQKFLAIYEHFHWFAERFEGVRSDYHQVIE